MHYILLNILNYPEQTKYGAHISIFYTNSPQIIITKSISSTVCQLLLQIIQYFCHPENIYKATADNFSLL